MRINGKISFKAHMDLNRRMAKPTAQPPRAPKQQPNMQLVLVVVLVILLIQDPNVTTFTDLISPDSGCYSIYSSDQISNRN